MSRCDATSSYSGLRKPRMENYSMEKMDILHSAVVDKDEHLH
jgi:hypothetical protein